MLIDNPSINLADLKCDNIIKINGKNYYAINLESVIKARSANSPIEDKVKNATEIFNAKKQWHKNWFILDLETGSRGIYPGCKLMSKTVSNDVPIHSVRNDNSEIVIHLLDENLDVEILERYSQGNPYWYYCKYTDNNNVEYVGYTRVENLKDLKYV